MTADVQRDTLAIPRSVREIVDARDDFHCRLCGAYLGERRALHHIEYGGDTRGMGGRREHDPAKIVSLCWLPYDNGCHDRVHSDKNLWQPLLLECARRPGVTALQLRRWQNRLTQEST